MEINDRAQRNFRPATDKVFGKADDRRAVPVP